MASALNRIRRGTKRRARKGKGFPVGLLEGVGTRGNALKVGGVVEEADPEKEYQGRLLPLGNSST